MLKWIEATGRSEDAAVQNALAQLGWTGTVCP